MAYKKHRAALAANRVHPAQTFPLELSIAHRKDFIDSIYNGTARVVLFMHGLVSDTQVGQLRFYAMTLTLGLLLLVGIGVIFI